MSNSNLNQKLSVVLVLVLISASLFAQLPGIIAVSAQSQPGNFWQVRSIETRDFGVGQRPEKTHEARDYPALQQQTRGLHIDCHRRGLLEHPRPDHAAHHDGGHHAYGLSSLARIRFASDIEPWEAGSDRRV